MTLCYSEYYYNSHTLNWPAVIANNLHFVFDLEINIIHYK